MIYETIVSRILVDKGWSGDGKYCVTDAQGNQYLLRISPPERYERRKNEFEHMKQVAALEIPMCRPIEFGACEEGVYSLESWIDGTDAELVVPGLSERKQYSYGLDAGRILRRIHTIPAPSDAQPWEPRFNRKMDRKIDQYEACPLKYEGGETFLNFIAANRHLLKDRPQTYQHGDFHIGNMMIASDGTLTIIDFDRDDYGDPWEEFNRIVWCVQSSPAFASGMVDGYFNNIVPMEFWRLLALYISSNTLSSLPWAVSFGGREIATMQQQAAQVLEWYDGMKRMIPSWYLRGSVEY